MKVINICQGSWASNCYALISDAHAIIIDPSASTKAILDLLESEGAVLDGIFMTHGHFDHVLSLDTLREQTKAPAFIYSEDAIMLTDGKKNAFYDFFGKERIYRAAENLLSDGEVIRVGSEELKVLHTPGHSKGSVCFIGNGVIFSGDTLFADSYGRCDLFGGDMSKMVSSLSLLRTLDPKLKLYAGHGMESTLGRALDNVAYLL